MATDAVDGTYAPSIALKIVHTIYSSSGYVRSRVLVSQSVTPFEIIIMHSRECDIAFHVMDSSDIVRYRFRAAERITSSKVAKSNRPKWKWYERARENLRHTFECANSHDLRFDIATKVRTDCTDAIMAYYLLFQFFLRYYLKYQLPFDVDKFFIRRLAHFCHAAVVVVGAAVHSRSPVAVRLRFRWNFMRFGDVAK